MALKKYHISQNLWNNLGFSATAINTAGTHIASNIYGTTLSTTTGGTVEITQSNIGDGTNRYQNGFFCIEIDFSQFSIGDNFVISFDYEIVEKHNTQNYTIAYIGQGTSSVNVSGNWGTSGRAIIKATFNSTMTRPYVEIRLCGNSIKVKNVQVNRGTNTLPYEPFETDNLFNESAGIKGYYINASGEEVQNTSTTYEFAHTQKIPVQPNTRYTYSLNISQTEVYRRIIAYDLSQNFLSQISDLLLSNIGYNSYSFTTPSNCYYITINYLDNMYNNEDTNLMLNIGASAEPYVPYGSTWNDIPYRRYETATDAVTTLPVTLYTDGQPIAANLFDEEYLNIGTTIKYQPIYVGDGTFTLSTSMPTHTVEGSAGNFTNLFFLSGNVSTGASTNNNGVWLSHSITQNATDGYITIAYRIEINNPSDYETMLNSGSTALPYQPYAPWVMKGNTETSGNPSSQNPITISGVGNKTANLLPTNITWYLNNNASAMDKSDVSDIRIKTDVFPVSDTNAYLTVGGFNLPNIDGLYLAAIRFYDDDLTTPLTTSGSGNTRAIPTGAKWASLLYGTNSTTFDTSTIKSAMQSAQLTAIYGQTAPTSYIPFGYEISISSNQTALTPVYLTEQLMKIGDYADSLASGGTVTYNIKKLVLTGQDSFWGADGTLGTLSRYWILPTGADAVMRGSREDLYCTHYTADAEHAPNTIYVYSGTTGVFIYFYVPTADYPTLADYKAYIQQQYANGTPVILYYILATPTTESVTAPSIPTTGGEVSIDVDTTVKPSELDFTYHGWHSHQPKKKSANLCNGVFEQNGINNAGNLVESASRVRTFIDVKPNTQYTFNSNEYLRIIYGYNGDSKVGIILDTSDNASKTYTFTTAATVNKIGIALMNNAYSSSATAIVPSDVQNAMLNEGSTALPYVPYWE